MPDPVHTVSSAPQKDQHMHPLERTRSTRFDTFKNSVRLGRLTHSCSRDIRGKPVPLPFSVSGESETEEWWFDVRPKEVGKRRPPIDELLAESSKSSSTSDATTARWCEAFGTRAAASQSTRRSEWSSPSGTRVWTKRDPDLQVWKRGPSLFRLALKRSPRCWRQGCWPQARASEVLFS